jgi:RHS repeat-associated protein
VVDAASGTLSYQYSYDSWGWMRNVSTWANYGSGSEPSPFVAGRGYTGHEYLPWFNLINMNGRMYDPLVGQFLSPDNIIQNPYNSQNLNRYSYCLNNPLLYTDLSGMTFYGSGYSNYNSFGTPYHQTLQELWDEKFGAMAWEFKMSLSDQQSFWSYYEEAASSGGGGSDGDKYSVIMVSNPVGFGFITVFVPTSPLGGGANTALIAFAPKHTDAFDGFWGKARYFLFGPNVGNARYDMNGKYLGPALVGGIAPAPGIKGGYSIYQGIRNGKVVYWGLTNNFSRRVAEHAGRFDDIIEVFPNLTRRQARGLEQLMIDKYGIQNLENIRNGIGVSNPNMMQYFQDAVRVLLGL